MNRHLPNFAHPSGALERPWSFASGVLLVLVVGGSLLAWHLHRERRTALLAQEQAISLARMMAAQRAERGDREAMVRRKLEAIDHAAEPWLAMRQLPWDESLRALERLAVPGLRVQRLLVSADSRQLELQAAAESLEAVSKAMEHLQGAEQGPATWRLERMQRSAAGGAESALSIVLIRSVPR